MCQYCPRHICESCHLFAGFKRHGTHHQRSRMRHVSADRRQEGHVKTTNATSHRHSTGTPAHHKHPKSHDHKSTGAHKKHSSKLSDDLSRSVNV